MCGKASSRHTPRRLLFSSSVFVYSRDLFSLFVFFGTNKVIFHPNVYLAVFFFLVGNVGPLSFL